MSFGITQPAKKWFARQPRVAAAPDHPGAQIVEDRARPDHASRPSEAVLPLSLVTAGETVTLSCIRDDTRLRQRVADLGLTIGLTVRVVKNDFHGPLIVAVKRDARLAIAREVAQRIQTHTEHNKGNHGR